MPAENAISSFQDLSVDGFRRLRGVRLSLRPLTVMIGANGSGKTSILDVLSMLASSAQGQLSVSISELSGLRSILTDGRADSLRFGISMSVPDHEPLNYELSIQPHAVSYAIDVERLSQRHPGRQAPFLHIDSRGPEIKYYDVSDRRLITPNWEYRPLETSLSQVPKMFREPEEFRNRLSSSTFYHALNVEPRSPVRLPQPVRPAPLPGRNGEELVSCLFYLREAERSRFEAVEDALRAAFPRFQRLDFPPVAAGTIALAWRDDGFSQPLYMHQLSEGTLRFLWLATLLQSPGLTALTLLDEPEVGLHPELLSMLAELMREASSRTQLVVATHSDRLVRFLEPREVLLVDSDEQGMSKLAWSDELDLDEWLKDYSLDELWSNGRLGARA
jgi:predicted ATPase